MVNKGDHISNRAQQSVNPYAATLADRRTGFHTLSYGISSGVTSIRMTDSRR